MYFTDNTSATNSDASDSRNYTNISSTYTTKNKNKKATYLS